jgi:hypothetical protein
MRITFGEIAAEMKDIDISLFKVYFAVKNKLWNQSFILLTPLAITLTRFDTSFDEFKLHAHITVIL